MSAIPDQDYARADSRLESLYAVRDSGVNHILAGNPDLVATLMDVAEVIPRYFGLDASLALETIEDPEEDLPSRELFAVISTTQSPNQALKRLKAFDEEWWLARSIAIGPQLTVTLD